MGIAKRDLRARVGEWLEFYSTPFVLLTDTFTGLSKRVKASNELLKSVSEN